MSIIFFTRRTNKGEIQINPCALCKTPKNVHYPFYRSYKQGAVSNQSLLMIRCAAICWKYDLQGMKLFLTSVDLKLFYRLYLEKRTGYANRHNFSGVKPIKNTFSKFVKC
jgi:hypothetical protein